MSPRNFLLHPIVPRMDVHLVSRTIFSFRSFRFAEPGVYKVKYQGERTVSRQFRQTSISLCLFMGWTPFSIEGHTFLASVFVGAYLRTVYCWFSFVRHYPEDPPYTIISRYYPSFWTKIDRLLEVGEDAPDRAMQLATMSVHNGIVLYLTNLAGVSPYRKVRIRKQIYQHVRSLASVVAGSGAFQMLIDELSYESRTAAFI